MDGEIAMSRREMDRVRVIRKVLEGRLTQARAAEMLKLSLRQIKRLCGKFRAKGPAGLAHRLRGRTSNHQIDPWLLETALNALHDPLWDGFGPAFARDKLKELCGVTLGVKTLRQLMTQAGLWRPRGQRLKHRRRLERRDCVGMFVHLCGSDYDWFEGRGPRCVLIIYIDDATSRVLYGEFAQVEDPLTLMRMTRSYLKQYGRPMAFSIGWDSIDTNNAPADEQPLPQFVRAMSELGVEIVTTNSSKGRVKQGFFFPPDGLVTELRLRGISNVASANRYLQRTYLPLYNARNGVAPRSTLDAHRPLIAGVDLLDVLSVKLKRVVRNDCTLQCFGRRIRLAEGVGARPKAEIIVQTRIDGKVLLLYRGRRLACKPLYRQV